MDKPSTTNNLYHAYPQTPVVQVATYEDLFHKYPADPVYFQKRARALTFFWDKEDIELVVPKTGLRAVPLGEGRYARNGVHYSQLPTPNPNKLIYRVHAGQFRTRWGEHGLENGFDIVIEDANRTPNGVLVVIKKEDDGLGWTFAINRKGDLVSGSESLAQVGEPTMTIKFPPPTGSMLGNLLRRASSKLIGEYPVKR